jgi:hypothetical protein
LLVGDLQADGRAQILNGATLNRHVGSALSIYGSGSPLA